MGYGYVSCFSLQAIGFFVLVLVGSVSCENTICPFNYMFHTGDGYFDTGNAIRIPPLGPKLPANNRPYGFTFPGNPSGRWSDGLLDVDMGGAAMGFPKISPYLGGILPSDTAFNFAVARSPILDRDFFTSRGVKIPPYAAPLRTQLRWLNDFLDSVCSTPTECTEMMADSMVIFGDIDANDVAIPLTQGKTIQEVMTYVPFVTEAQINAAREVIRMGATRVVISANNPIGCYPYILTELGSNIPEDYDDIGCLRKINDLIKYKNADLKRAVDQLIEEFPDIIIIYGEFYDPFQIILRDSMSGPDRDVTLKACCGIGGRYNYDSNRFCGTPGVPVCADPSKYISWDGMHLTQNAHDRLTRMLQEGIVPTFNCTPPPELRVFDK